MTVQAIILQLLTVLLPVCGVVLPGILKKNHYPNWLNGLIAGVVVIVCAAGTAFARGQFGPDLAQNFLIVVAAISALLAGPLKGLDEFLQAHVNGSTTNASSTVSAPAEGIVPQQQPFSVPPGPGTTIGQQWGNNGASGGQQKGSGG